MAAVVARSDSRTVACSVYNTCKLCKLHEHTYVTRIPRVSKLRAHDAGYAKDVRSAAGAFAPLSCLLAGVLMGACDKAFAAKVACVMPRRRSKERPGRYQKVRHSYALKLVFKETDKRFLAV